MDGRPKKFIIVLFGLTWLAMLWLCVSIWATNNRISATLVALERIEGPRTCTTEDKLYVAKHQIINKNKHNLREFEIRMTAEIVGLEEQVDGLKEKANKLKERVEEGIQATYYVQGQLKAVFNELLRRSPLPKNRSIPMRFVTGKERAFFEDLIEDAKRVEKDLRK